MRVFDIDTIVEHYLIAEVWAAVIYLDENTPVEADTIDAPIHDDTVAAARADVLGFLDADVREICERHNIADEQIGHENVFWSADRAIMVAEQRHLPRRENREVDEFEVSQEPGATAMPL